MTKEFTKEYHNAKRDADNSAMNNRNAKSTKKRAKTSELSGSDKQGSDPSSPIIIGRKQRLLRSLQPPKKKTAMSTHSGPANPQPSKNQKSPHQSFSDRIDACYTELKSFSQDTSRLSDDELIQVEEQRLTVLKKLSTLYNDRVKLNAPGYKESTSSTDNSNASSNSDKSKTPPSWITNSFKK